MKNTQIEVIRTNRKTLVVEITRDLRIIVRAPMLMSDASIERFINDKTPLIEKHLERMKCREGSAEPFTCNEIKALAERAREEIPKKVYKLAADMDVGYGRITIRNQISRWGSCSAKGNLNFNCLLMLCPDEVIDYVVIHELCHLRRMDHSKEFWADVEKYCPEYKVHREWLKDQGSQFIRRLRNG